MGNDPVVCTLIYIPGTSLGRDAGASVHAGDCFGVKSAHIAKVGYRIFEMEFDINEKEQKAWTHRSLPYSMRCMTRHTDFGWSEVEKIVSPILEFRFE